MTRVKWFYKFTDVYRIHISCMVSGHNGHKPKRPQTETAINRNGHKPKRPQTGTATNRKDHKPKRPQTEKATNRNSHKPKRPQIEKATDQNGHKLNEHKTSNSICVETWIRVQLFVLPNFDSFLPVVFMSIRLFINFYITLWGIAFCFRIGFIDHLM